MIVVVAVMTMFGHMAFAIRVALSQVLQMRFGAAHDDGMAFVAHREFLMVILVLVAVIVIATIFRPADLSVIVIAVIALIAGLETDRQGLEAELVNDAHQMILGDLIANIAQIDALASEQTGIISAELAL